MPTPRTDSRCLACGRNSHETPLIRLEYLDRDYYICPQHMPVLIHDPSSLIGALPGAEHLKPADHRD